MTDLSVLLIPGHHLNSVRSDVAAILAGRSPRKSDVIASHIDGNRWHGAGSVVDKAGDSIRPGSSTALGPSAHLILVGLAFYQIAVSVSSVANLFNSAVVSVDSDLILDCARQSRPGVSTRVSALLSWVLHVDSTSSSSERDAFTALGIRTIAVTVAGSDLDSDGSTSAQAVPCHDGRVGNGAAIALGATIAALAEAAPSLLSSLNLNFAGQSRRISAIVAPVDIQCADTAKLHRRRSWQDNDSVRTSGRPLVITATVERSDSVRVVNSGNQTINTDVSLTSGAQSFGLTISGLLDFVLYLKVGSGKIGPRNSS